MNHSRTILTAAAVLAAALASGGPVAGQAVAAPDIKAAYLYNFAQFVEWPAAVLPPGAPLVLCIIEDTAVVDALVQTMKGRTVGGHGLTAVPLKTGAPLPTCHVLYVAGPDLKRALAVIETVKGSSVLTVSDAEHFARTGGMVELFLDKGRMRFAVNVDALERGRIRLSSRVLALATIVRDGRSQ